MTYAFNIIQKNHLSLKLTPISIRELLFINDTPCEIFGLEGGLFTLILHKSAFINKNVLKDLIAKGQIHLFVYMEDRHRLIQYIQNALTQVTRSLSVGNQIEKVKRQMNLLTINMSFVYQNPTNDEFLKLQHQCAKNLAYFLMERPNLHEGLYKDFLKQKHHFIYAQPLLSSIFVLGILKYGQLYSDQEVENFFITSYFKDLGMSAIAADKYDQDDLNDEEKETLAKHAKNSVLMVKGRLPISPNHLNIIENHHAFSLLEREIDPDRNYQADPEMMIGFETVIISMMDIISAMISGRPYRKATKLFESLDLIKALIADQYPQEFKLIVGYFKNFFFDKSLK